MSGIKELSRRLSVALVKAVGMKSALEKLVPASDSEFILMCALNDGKPHSQKEIADGLGMSRTTVNGIVKQWEKKGLLTFNKIAGKRREKQIVLTELGREKINKSVKLSRDMEDGALMRTVEKYSDAFVEALEYYANELREDYETRKSTERRRRKLFGMGHSEKKENKKFSKLIEIKES